jgi:hypothetical protein
MMGEVNEEAALVLNKVGAKLLATEAAWECGPESIDSGRTLLHSRAGGIGADWDLDDVLAFIEKADEVGFGFSLLGHEMYVVAQDDGRERVVHFDVTAPKTEAQVERVRAAGGWE